MHRSRTVIWIEYIFAQVHFVSIYSAYSVRCDDDERLFIIIIAHNFRMQSRWFLNWWQIRWRASSKAHLYVIFLGLWFLSQISVEIKCNWMQLCNIEVDRPTAANASRTMYICIYIYPVWMHLPSKPWQISKRAAQWLVISRTADETNIVSSLLLLLWVHCPHRNQICEWSQMSASWWQIPFDSFGNGTPTPKMIP